MIKKIAATALIPLTSCSFAAELDIDKYAVNQEDFRNYSPAESCKKATEALKIFTQLLSNNAEQQHLCLQQQLSESTPKPLVCLSSSEAFPPYSFVQQYEQLRWIDCNPKRDPAYPRRTTAYRFLEN